MSDQEGKFSTQLTSRDFDVYTTIADAVTAVANGTFGVCRAIRCEASGTLVVTRERDGVHVALPFGARETQPVQTAEIISSGSSGCAPITVYR